MSLYCSVDDWFDIDEILSSKNEYVFLMRGKLKLDPNAGRRVVLKCHTVFPFVEDGAHYVKGELAIYERAMYKYAVPELKNPDLFVGYVGSLTRRYAFQKLDEASTEGMGFADAALLEWCKRFPFTSAEQLNYGTNILITEDHGKISAKDFIVNKNRVSKFDLSEFIVQMVSALDMMAETQIVHGDLRWNNVMYPRSVVEGSLYFDAKRRVFESEFANEHCVAVSRVVKVFDWDNAFFSSMPSHVVRDVYHSYHASGQTNMNDVYDKIGFLRLLHVYFPNVFFQERDVEGMEPAFSSYAYVDKRDEQVLYQVSKTETPWPSVDRLRSAVDAVMLKVYREAYENLVVRRKMKHRKMLELAVEGDNGEALRKLVSYPYVTDLNEESFSLINEYLREKKESLKKLWMNKALEEIGNVKITSTAA